MLICPPILGEYFRTYQVLADISHQLARQGFDVLRFDYRGTGDSAGTFSRFAPTQWVEDIGAAANELVQLAGVTELRVVTVRLSTLLALQASRTFSVPLARAVCWDPVTDGSTYLAELRQSYAGFLAVVRKETGTEPRIGEHELMGFEFSTAAFEEIGRLSFNQIWQGLDQKPALHLVSSNMRAGGMDASASSRTDLALDCNWLTISEQMLFASEIVSALLGGVSGN